MGPNLSLADRVEEIRLAAPNPRGGALSRRLRGIFGPDQGGKAAGGSLRVTDPGLLLRAEGQFEAGLEIPWRAVRKLVVDDGTRWGYVSGVCRFPVYDLRPDGSGSGVLIGPLWSSAGSLLPDGCPTAEVEPVPAQAPNLAILFDPPLAIPGQANAAILLLRAEDPVAAREALAPQRAFGDIAHDDLEFLTEAARHPHRASLGQQASAASA